MTISELLEIIDTQLKEGTIDKNGFVYIYIMGKRCRIINAYPDDSKGSLTIER